MIETLFTIIVGLMIFAILLPIAVIVSVLLFSVIIKVFFIGHWDDY